MRRRCPLTGAEAELKALWACSSLLPHGGCTCQPGAGVLGWHGCSHVDLSLTPLYLFWRKNWIRSPSYLWYCRPQGKAPWLLCWGGIWVLFKGDRPVCPQMCANHTCLCVFAIFFPGLGPDRIHLHRDHHGMLPVWRPLLFWVCELQCVCGDRSLADSVQSQPSHENSPDQLEPDSE